MYKDKIEMHMPLTTITLEASSTKIDIGGISVIWASCNISPCPTLTWSISDPTIADLEINPTTVSCIITGKSDGNLNITASSGNITSNSITITVIGPSLQYIEIDPKTVDIGIGKTVLFQATCKDQNNDNIICPTLIWNSSNPSAGTIDQTGLLTGISESTTKITAFAAGITSDIALVTVSPVRLGELVLFGGLVISAVYMILRKPK